MYHSFLAHSFTDGHLGCSENVHHKQRNKPQVLERLWRKGDPSALLVGMQTGATTVENSMEIPKKIKNGNTLGCRNSTSVYFFIQRNLKH